MVVLLLMFFYQERLIFFPTKLPPDHQYRFGMHFEQHWLEVDGKRADSLLFPVANAAGTILFFHGNAGSLQDWGHVASEIAGRSSWNVWVVDYPGYGRSEGRISSEQQLHDLGAELLKAARAKFGAEEKIVLYGRSIGSGIAVKLASEQPVSAVILESPYLSLSQLARALFPWAPGFFLKYKMRSDQWIGQIQSPILIVHGEQDEIIPFAQGEALSKLGQTVTFKGVPRARHNDLSLYEGYWSAILEFLNRL